MRRYDWSDARSLEAQNLNRMRQVLNASFLGGHASLRTPRIDLRIDFVKGAAERS